MCKFCPNLSFDTTGMTKNEIVKQLRELTGFGVMECKKLLDIYDYNLKDAYDNIRSYNMRQHMLVNKRINRTTK